jgi:hypothetical protein
VSKLKVNFPKVIENFQISVGFYMMYVLFVIKRDSEEELNIEIITDTDKYDPKTIEKVFSNEIYRKSIKTWLPFLTNRGFLDTLLPSAPLTPFMTTSLQQMQQGAA